MHHAFRQPRGARRIHDVERVIERKTFQLEVLRLTVVGLRLLPRLLRGCFPEHPFRGCLSWSAGRSLLACLFFPLGSDETPPQRALPHAVQIGHLLSVWCDDYVLQRRDPEGDLSETWEQIDLFAVVEVSVGGEENSGRNL